MGALAELDVTEAAPITGTGRSLVRWWVDIADDDDRAAFRRWVDTGTGCNTLAERLTAAGFPISKPTVMYGLRLLRRLPEWAS